MNRLKIAATISTGLTVAFLFLISFPAPSQAQVDPLLPPRPTPEPVAATSTSQGATIILSIPVADGASIDSDDWALVQWQDNQGDWHNVAGWQGNLAYDASTKSWEVIWWVARANLGEKSFRWVIYSDEGRAKRVATSETFDLPVKHLHGVVVSLK